MELATKLEHRYRSVLESGSDPEFYQNVHQYCDLVMKNPTLSAILEKDQLDYSTRHSALWRERSLTDEEADEKADMTMRIERFSMYCDSASLIMRIYYPIEDYKYSTGPESEQDPVALVMMHEIKNISTKRWSKKTLLMYNRWFEGKRPRYETDLRKFHSKLLSALDTVDEPVEQKQARPILPIMFSTRTGDFRINGVSGNFNPKGQEFKVFQTLYENPEHIASYLELVRAIRPHIDQASKAHKDDLFKIVDSIRKELGTQKDILQNVKNDGYRLVFPSQEVERE